MGFENILDRELTQDEKHFVLLLGFVNRDILTGVDGGLRRAVKWLLVENKKQSQELLEYGFKDASREYWDNWAGSID